MNSQDTCRNWSTHSLSNQTRTPRLFPTALTNFLECHHLTVLERLAAANLAKRPFFDDPMLEILRERGLNHERAYVQYPEQVGKRVREINRSSPNAFEDTIAAMREAVDVVVQARLENGSWAGWPDILVRVDGESRFGSWRYEPVETKLARETGRQWAPRGSMRRPNRQRLSRVS
jgi:predicted RecB family nuclease